MPLPLLHGFFGLQLEHVSARSFMQDCVWQHPRERKMALPPAPWSWSEPRFWELENTVSPISGEQTQTHSSFCKLQGLHLLDFKTGIALVVPITLPPVVGCRRCVQEIKWACEGTPAVFHRALCKHSAIQLGVSATSFTCGSSPLLITSASVDGGCSIVFWSKWHFKCQASWVLQQMVSSTKCNWSNNRNILLNMTLKGATIRHVNHVPLRRQLPPSVAAQCWSLLLF